LKPTSKVEVLSSYLMYLTFSQVTNTLFAITEKEFQYNVKTLLREKQIFIHHIFLTVSE
jgi:hypothetical protein